MEDLSHEFMQEGAMKERKRIIKMINKKLKSLEKYIYNGRVEGEEKALKQLKQKIQGEED